MNAPKPRALDRSGRPQRLRFLIGGKGGECKRTNSGSLRVAGAHFKLGKTPLLRYVVRREPRMFAPPNAPPPTRDEIKSRLAPFCQRHGIARGEAFGSLAPEGI